jgi:site-specific DNA recombinase
MTPRQSRRGPDIAKAVAYLRVSTAEQHLGPEAQRASIETWAAREGVTIVAWHVDHGVSGGSEIDDRPGLVAALGQVRAEGAGAFVVAKRDRLARDVYIAATIERAVTRSGARVVCADGVGNGETPADAFMRSILDAAAAYERALIRARTKAALAVKKARGENTGSPPYGFRVILDEKRLIPDEREQETLTALRALRAEGLSFRAVRRESAARGFMSRSGRPFESTAMAGQSGPTNEYEVGAAVTLRALRPWLAVNDDYNGYESYRNELTAALLRIEQMEDELALFRADPAYERVEAAGERLARARARRRRVQKILPRVCIASFVAMGAFALTDPSLPVSVHVMAYVSCAAGGATAVLTIVWMLVLAAQGARPKSVLELERNVRIAKGDVGKRLRSEVGYDRANEQRAQGGAHGADVGIARVRELPEDAGDESTDRIAHAHRSRM